MNNTENAENFKMSKELVDYTDNIYYKNGIMDKIYYILIGLLIFEWEDLFKGLSVSKK